jgi:hypothetical protein
MGLESLWLTWATIRTTCVSLRAEFSFRTLIIRALRQKAPMESLLRSALLVLMDNTTAEYTFVTTFFSPDANPVPVRKETLMSPPIGHGSLSPTVPDDETGSPAGGHSATTSTSLGTPLTLDTNSNSSPSNSLSRGARPHPNILAHLSKEDQALLNAVWKQITDPAVEYTQVGTLLRDLRSNLNNNDPCRAIDFSPARMYRKPDLRQVMHGADPPDYPAAHYDPSDGRRGERDPTTRVCSAGDRTVHHEVADVAWIPKGHVGSRGTTQEVYRWCNWFWVRWWILRPRREHD